MSGLLVVTRRGVELGLLVFSAGVVTLALILVQAQQKQQLSRSLLYRGLAYWGLFVLAHTAVRWLAPHADPLILPCAALLNGLGLVMIHRLDLGMATQAIDSGESIPSADPVRWRGPAVALVLFVAVLWRVRDQAPCHLRRL